MSIINKVNEHTNLPRPLPQGIKDNGVKQNETRNTAPNYAFTGIEGGVLNFIDKSKIYI